MRAAAATAAMSSLLSTIALCAPPSLLMLVLSFVGYGVAAPKVLIAALQHLAAGIVTCAVAVELVPIISDAPNDLANTAAITVGFVLGIALFLLLGEFCEVEDPPTPVVAPADPSRAEQLSEQLLPPPQLPPPLESSGSTRLRVAASVIAAASRIKNEGRRVRKGSKLAQAQVAVERRVAPFPVTLATAVAVDSFVDGFLIGLSAASGTNAGFVMSAALSIEMGFLGLTYAAALTKQPRWLATLAMIGPPVILVLGGAGGALLAAAVAGTALHVGLISFGVAALLYLVTEELLLEAHSEGEGHVWWVDCAYFAGFLGSFLLEKAVDASGRR